LFLSNIIVSLFSLSRLFIQQRSDFTDDERPFAIAIANKKKHPFPSAFAVLFLPSIWFRFAKSIKTNEDRLNVRMMMSKHFEHANRRHCQDVIFCTSTFSLASPLSEFTPNTDAFVAKSFATLLPKHKMNKESKE
jgi:hypothetical protein